MTPRRLPPWIEPAVREHEPALIRYAHSLLGDRHRARDAVQDTLLRLCRQPKHKVDRGVKTWLFTTCRRRCLDLRKKEARMKPLADSPHADADADPQSAEAPPPDAPAIAAEAHAELHRRLAELPENQREVVRLRFAQHMSYREIADVTGHKTGHVGYLLHHALKTLRTQLTPD